MALNLPIVVDFDGRGLKRAVAEFKNLETNAAKAQYAINKAAAPAAAALAGLGAAAFKAAQKASDLQEQINKTNVVFGTGADSIKAFARTAATGIGQSETQALQAAGTFGVLGKAAGLSGQQLVGFTKQFTTLAADLASFNNTTVDEAIVALGAALRGESEPIRRFGVLLDDATLRTEALSLGLIANVKEALTPQQKSLAAQSAILKQTTDAQGDFARTSDSAANAQKILKAQLDNAVTNLGKSFLPLMEKVVPLLSNMAQFAEQNAPLIGAMAVSVGLLSAAILAVNGAMALYKGIAVITTLVNTALATSFTAVQVATVVGIGTAVAGAATFVALSAKIRDAIPNVEQFGTAMNTMGGRVADASVELTNSEIALAKFVGPLAPAQEAVRQFASQVLKAKEAAAQLKREEAAQKAAQAASEAATKAGNAFKALKGKLADARQSLRDYAKSLADTVRGYVSLSGAVATVQQREDAYNEALAERAAAYAELNKLENSETKSAEALAEAKERVARAETAVTTAQGQRTNYVAQFREQIEAAKKFAGQLQQLIQQGLSRAGLAQLMNLGPVAGSQVAADLLAGTSGYSAAALSADLAGLDVAGAALGETAIAGDMSLLNQASAGRTGNKVYITVNGGDPQQVVDALRRYMQLNGSVPIRVSG